jgi:hypothetical protein
VGGLPLFRVLGRFTRRDADRSIPRVSQARGACAVGCRRGAGAVRRARRLSRWRRMGEAGTTGGVVRNSVRSTRTSRRRAGRPPIGGQWRLPLRTSGGASRCFSPRAPARPGQRTSVGVATRASGEVQRRASREWLRRSSGRPRATDVSEGSPAASPPLSAAMALERRPDTHTRVGRALLPRSRASPRISRTPSQDRVRLRPADHLQGPALQLQPPRPGRL